MNAHFIAGALRKRFPAQECALFFEVGDGTGMNARRHADAVMMNLWPSRGMTLEGFEIKVTRADLKRELLDPSKAESIARHCDRWWLVTPHTLKIQDGELPVTWGHMQVKDDGTIKVAVAAETHPRSPAIDRSFVAAILRSAQKSAHAEEDRVFQERVAAEVERRVAIEASNAIERQGLATQVAAVLEAAGVRNRWDSSCTAQQLGEIMRAVIAMNGYGGLRDTVQHMQTIRDRIGEMIDSSPAMMRAVGLEPSPTPKRRRL